MKQSIIVTVLLTIFTSYSFASPTEDINTSIKTSFHQEFKNAQILSAESYQTFTKLTFKMDEAVLSAFYTDNGELLALTRNILSSQLPLNLLSSLRKKYSTYWITDLFEFDRDSQSCYYISLENADTKMTLRSNGDSWQLYSSVKK
ncbi:MAG: hypothetical protein JST42_00160 [Bacteroidetes bacterium]|nr:hypothetical protein [Bacteroidota bacterium]